MCSGCTPGISKPIVLMIFRVLASITDTVPATSDVTQSCDAVGGELGVARARPDQNVVDHLVSLGVDEMRHVRGLRRGDQDLAVGTYAHALGLDPDRHLGHHLPVLEVDRRHQRVVLVGDVDRAARGMDVDLLGIRARRQIADDLAAGEIEDLHGVVVARADQHLLAVLGQYDAARALTDGNGPPAPRAWRCRSRVIELPFSLET